jgi:hypothetical protein
MSSPIQVFTINNRDRAATRDELNGLFLKVVCPSTCPNVVEIMTEKELRRLVAIGLLQYFIVTCRKTKSMAVLQVGIITRLNRSTLYEYTQIFNL